MKLTLNRDAIRRLAAQHGARDVRIFGSVARDESKSDSDLDVLVTMEPGRTLFDLIALEQDLEELLGRPVDGRRDKLVHDYFGVDLALVGGVVERELPTVRKRVAAVLAQLA